MSGLRRVRHLISNEKCDASQRCALKHLCGLQVQPTRCTRCRSATNVSRADLAWALLLITRQTWLGSRSAHRHLRHCASDRRPIIARCISVQVELRRRCPPSFGTCIDVCMHPLKGSMHWIRGSGQWPAGPLYLSTGRPRQGGSRARPLGTCPHMFTPLVLAARGPRYEILFCFVCGVRCVSSAHLLFHHCHVIRAMLLLLPS